MNKQEVIDKLFHKLKSNGYRYPKMELTSIVDPFLEVIIESLEGGDEVRLTHFGKFIIKITKGRRFYNIQMGRVEHTSDKKYIAFVPSRFIDLEKSASKLDEQEQKNRGIK